MIKLIVSDIDGTLIKDSTPDLYPEMAQAIRAFKKQGIIFCAASGRQYQSIHNVFRDVQEDLVYIAENGAQIRYKDQDLHITPMDRSTVEQIVEQLRQCPSCEIVASTPNGCLMETRDRAFIDLITYGYRNKFTLVEDVLAEEANIIKIAAYQRDSIRTLGEEVLIPRWQDRVKVCLAGEEWVDFMDVTVDKGQALSFVQDYFGITREETMAFGDNNNDIGMLKAAGESYAVENAREEVKKAAGQVCPSWLEKGVYRTVKHLIIS